MKAIKFQKKTKQDDRVCLGGKPVDVHILEDYLLQVSPYTIKTVLRYQNIRDIEEIKRYAMPAKNSINSKLWIIIIIAAVALLFGVIMLMYGPQLLDGIKGMVGGMH